LRQLSFDIDTRLRILQRIGRLSQLILMRRCYNKNIINIQSSPVFTLIIVNFGVRSDSRTSDAKSGRKINRFTF
jgi:hypothetical protein